MATAPLQPSIAAQPFSARFEPTDRRAAAGPRRASGQPQMGCALHEALVSANPDQVVWGTDWPHPRLDKDMPDDGHLLDLFNAWTPDSALRRKILVDNPARLYGFG